MPYDRPMVLFVTAEATDELQTAWAWIIRRDPDQMLIVRSRAEYANCFQALDAGNAAAINVSRRLGIPVTAKFSGGPID